jgi:hypothetical protein
MMQLNHDYQSMQLMTNCNQAQEFYIPQGYAFISEPMNVIGPIMVVDAGKSFEVKVFSY